MANHPSPMTVDAKRDGALRVCHLAYTFYETDNRVVRYAQALASRGDVVDVIALRRHGQTRAAEHHGVRVVRLQRRSKTETSSWSFALKLAAFMARAFFVLSVRHLRRRYDVVHVHNVPDFLVFCALIPRLFGAKVILDIHDALPELYADKFGVQPSSPAFRVLLLLERYSCRFADFVIVANHIWHARLVERAAVGGKSMTFLNYPDLTVFPPKPRRTAPPSQFRVVYPGSLSRHQGLDVAVKAFAAVHPQLAEAEFHIYGEGPARQELLDLSRALGMTDYIKLHDPVPVDQVGTLMSHATVGVEPKLATGFSGEALSTKILEFMATGTPVIVSRTFAHEFYFPADLVRFFPAGDVNALGTALVEARNQPLDDATALKLRTFAADYGWQHRVADYFRLIDGSRSSNHRGDC